MNRNPRENGGWQGRAERVLSQGCLTYSKSRRYYVSAQPSHVVGGAADKYLLTEDGEHLFDTVSGLGANLITCENSYSLPTIDEVMFVEELLFNLDIPGFDRAKVVKTGSEADGAAARFARGYTGKRGLYLLGYAGWHNEFVGAYDNPIGCSYTDVQRFDTLESLISALTKTKPGEIAGVIMEPVQLDPCVKAPLLCVRELCNRLGAVLIFDEVITGYRWPKYTVAKTLGVTPDLMTLGKALGGGYPLGVVVGPAKILDTEGVFVSGTFSGEQSALKAARALMTEVSPNRLKLFWEQANQFQSQANYHCSPAIRAVGYGTRMVLKDEVDGENVAKLMQEAARRHHILFGPVLFPKLSWVGADYTRLLGVMREIVADLPNIKLDGEKPRPVFKR